MRNESGMGAEWEGGCSNDDNSSNKGTSRVVLTARMYSSTSSTASPGPALSLRQLHRRVIAIDIDTGEARKTTGRSANRARRAPGTGGSRVAR